jgi:hypothetical protein
MKAEVIYSYFYDFSDEIDLKDVKNYFRGAEEFSFYEYGKAVPEGLNPFELPIVVNAGKKEVKFDNIDLSVNIQCVIYSVGAMAVRVRSPIENLNTALLEKITFDKRFENRFKELADDTKVRVEKTLSKHIHIKEKGVFEMYRSYFLEQCANSFVDKNKGFIAGILLDEQNYKELSNEYVSNTIKRSLSYYNCDSVIVDWDAMFLISNTTNYENEIMVADTANIQLLEYRVYQNEVNKMIDAVNNRFLKMKRNLIYTVFTRSSMIKLSKEISDFYAEYKDLVEGINQIIMSFGEWYLARLYSLLSDAFRLTDLAKRLETTFDMLVNIRSFIQSHVSEDTNSFLEWVVILLFVVEIVLIIIPFYK